MTQPHKARGMYILAIDPGNEESGYAVIDSDTCQPIDVGKVTNNHLRALIQHGALLAGVGQVSIEMIASYGMPVGKEVFDTCVWIGRYQEIIAPTCEVALIYRRDVKLHVCGTSKAKDANITQALVDRFAPGAGNHGKGTKASPGFFYGFRADIWQAYALAVLTADKRLLVASCVPASPSQSKGA